MNDIGVQGYEMIWNTNMNDKWSSKCRTPIERTNSAGEIWNSVFYWNKSDESEVVAADSVWGVFCSILY